MDKLLAVEMLVGKIPCPICLNSRHEVNIKSDLSNAPCDYHAICVHCNHKIIVSQDTKTIKAVWAQVAKHIIELCCPECKDHKLSLEFLCDVKSEEYFLVRCEDNGHYCRIDQKGIQFLFQ
jgi:hypothetical protein